MGGEVDEIARRCDAGFRRAKARCEGQKRGLFVGAIWQFEVANLFDLNHVFGGLIIAIEDKIVHYSFAVGRTLHSAQRLGPLGETNHA